MAMFELQQFSTIARMPFALQLRSVLLPASAAVGGKAAHHPCVYASMSPRRTSSARRIAAGACCVFGGAEIHLNFMRMDFLVLPSTARDLWP